MDALLEREARLHTWLMEPYVPERLEKLRQDRIVALVVIAIAVVIALGLMTAWWIACQKKGMYPALDMPSWNSGGTWKMYCKR